MSEMTRLTGVVITTILCTRNFVIEQFREHRRCMPSTKVHFNWKAWEDAGGQGTGCWIKHLSLWESDLLASSVWLVPVPPTLLSSCQCCHRTLSSMGSILYGITYSAFISLYWKGRKVLPSSPLVLSLWHLHRWKKLNPAPSTSKSNLWPPAVPKPKQPWPRKLSTEKAPSSSSSYSESKGLTFPLSSWYSLELEARTCISHFRKTLALAETCCLMLGLSQPRFMLTQ